MVLAVVSDCWRRPWHPIHPHTRAPRIRGLRAPYPDLHSNQGLQPISYVSPVLVEFRVGWKWIVLETLGKRQEWMETSKSESQTPLWSSLLSFYTLTLLHRHIHTAGLRCCICLRDSSFDTAGLFASIFLTSSRPSLQLCCHLHARLAGHILSFLILFFCTFTFDVYVNSILSRLNLGLFTTSPGTILSLHRPNDNSKNTSLVWRIFTLAQHEPKPNTSHDSIIRQPIDLAS